MQQLDGLAVHDSVTLATLELQLVICFVGIGQHFDVLRLSTTKHQRLFVVDIVLDSKRGWLRIE